jgi:LmbE family N-acetylglucosaminyl deacetylase
MDINSSLSVAIIVAHPDDETLWAGGTILNNPSWNCHIISLCRKNDEDRAKKFYAALKILHSSGAMGDLNDEPEQLPINTDVVEEVILDLLPKKNYDLIISHNPTGEYTRHLRHEETSKAVINLWNKREITIKQLWTFAYEDGQKTYLPKAIDDASYFEELEEEVWQKKYKLITETYGFEKNSWEAQTTPKMEAFWIFDTVKDAIENFKIYPEK